MAVQAGQRTKFSSQAKPELLASLREIARSDGRHFQAVLERRHGQLHRSQGAESGPP